MAAGGGGGYSNCIRRCTQRCVCTHKLTAAHSRPLCTNTTHVRVLFVCMRGRGRVHRFQEIVKSAASFPAPRQRLQLPPRAPCQPSGAAQQGEGAKIQTAACSTTRNTTRCRLCVASSHAHARVRVRARVSNVCPRTRLYSQGRRGTQNVRARLVPSHNAHKHALVRAPPRPCVRTKCAACAHIADCASTQVY